MRTYSHDVSLDFFQQLFASGSIPLSGAAMNNHEATCMGATVQDAAGQPTERTCANLVVGDTFQRIWSCCKKGFYPMFGMDRWRHDEVCHKKTDNELNVTDTFYWHDGQSFAQRSYNAVALGAGFVTHVGDWQVSLAGANPVIRQPAESALRVKMPEADARLNEIIARAAAA